MERKELMLLKARNELVYVPTLRFYDCSHLYAPAAFWINSVGTSSVHLAGHHDVLFQYCYASVGACYRRCLELFHIYTGQPPDEYPPL